MFGLYDTRVLNLCTGDVDLFKSLQNGMIWVTTVVMSTLRCNGSLAKYLRTTQMKSLTLKLSSIMLLIRSVAILYLGGTGLSLGFEQYIGFIVFSASGVTWASSRENLSSGFPTKRVSNRSPQLQRLARKLKFYMIRGKIGYFPKSE